MKNNYLHQKVYIHAAILFLSFVLLNCNKEVEELPETELIFHSLVSDKDTIAPGETTVITASASGNNLAYYWSATIGDILGSGSKITYAASPCQAGTNQITCKITTRGNQSASKTIDIVVYE